jgi:hypothetical protein
VYLRAHPLGARVARHALEPLINLARLHIRDGDGARAFDLIDTLYTAVSTRTHASIDGVDVPARLTDSREAHQDIRRWLWAVLLATGARAHAVAGRWQEARDRLHDHKGIGHRMFDGRQVAIIAHATSGDTDGALALLHDTEPGEPWENAVTACLALHCRSNTGTADVAALMDRYRALGSSAPGLAVFHTRLGLSLIDAFGPVGEPHAHQIALGLIDRAIESHDGYAARDVLGHSTCHNRLTSTQARELTALVGACALNRGTLPDRMLDDLTTALARAEEVITRTYRAHQADPTAKQAG